jgi:hypothetical protein
MGTDARREMRDTRCRVPENEIRGQPGEGRDRIRVEDTLSNGAGNGFWELRDRQK